MHDSEQGGPQRARAGGEEAAKLGGDFISAANTPDSGAVRSSALHVVRIARKTDSRRRGGQATPPRPAYTPARFSNFFFRSFFHSLPFFKVRRGLDPRKPARISAASRP